MPRLAQPLSDMQVKRAKAQEKLPKRFDGHGLYLEVQPSGAKFWRFRYRKAEGKETTMAFGPNPEERMQTRELNVQRRAGSCWAVATPLQQREEARRDSLRATRYTFQKIANRVDQVRSNPGRRPMRALFCIVSKWTCSQV